MTRSLAISISREGSMGGKNGENDAVYRAMKSIYSEHISPIERVQIAWHSPDIFRVVTIDGFCTMSSRKPGHLLDGKSTRTPFYTL